MAYCYVKHNNIWCAYSVIIYSFKHYDYNINIRNAMEKGKDISSAITETIYK